MPGRVTLHPTIYTVKVTRMGLTQDNFNSPEKTREMDLIKNEWRNMLLKYDADLKFKGKKVTDIKELFEYAKNNEICFKYGTDVILTKQVRVPTHTDANDANHKGVSFNFN